MKYLPAAFLIATITLSIWELIASFFGPVEKHGGSGGRGPSLTKSYQRSAFDEQRGP